MFCLLMPLSLIMQFLYLFRERLPSRMTVVFSTPHACISIHSRIIFQYIVTSFPFPHNCPFLCVLYRDELDAEEERWDVEIQSGSTLSLSSSLSMSPSVSLSSPPLYRVVQRSLSLSLSQCVSLRLSILSSPPSLSLFLSISLSLSLSLKHAPTGSQFVASKERQNCYGTNPIKSVCDLETAKFLQVHLG